MRTCARDTTYQIGCQVVHLYDSHSIVVSGVFSVVVSVPYSVVCLIVSCIIDMIHVSTYVL